MQLLIIVLNKVDVLEKLLERLCESGVRGATILESRGMAQSLCESEEQKFIASLQMLLDPQHKNNKTILTVVPDEQIPVVSKVLGEVTGGLDQPNSGVMFSVPVQYTEGFGEKQ